MRNKLTVSLLAVVCSLLFFFLQFVILFPDFQQLETNEALKNLDRVTEVIYDQIKEIKVIAKDIACSNNTYNIIEKKDFNNPRFSSYSLDNLEIDYLFILDPKLNLLYEHKGVYSNENFIALIKRMYDGYDSVGLLKIDDKTIFASILPVTKNECLGEPNAIIAIGRILNDDKITGIEERAQCKFQIWPIHEAPLEIRELDEKLTTGVQITKIVGHTIEAYKAIPCAYKRFNFIISASMERKITKEGKKSLVLAFLLILFSTIIVFSIGKILNAYNLKFIADKKFETFSLIAFIVFGYVLAISTDLFEKIYSFTRAYEKYNIDELFILTGFLSLSLIIFSMRRWMELYNTKGELEKTQSTLKKNEEQYRFLFDNMEEVLWLCDIGFNCLYITPSIKRVMGFTVDEVQDNLIFNLFSNDSFKDFIYEKIKKKDYSSDTIVFSALTKDNRKISIETTIIFVVEYSNFVGMQGVLRDVTLRQNAVSELENSEEKYRFLIENSNDIFWKLKPDFTYDYISPAVKNLLGYPPDDLIGASAIDRLHPEDAERIGTLLATRLEQQDFRPETIVVRQKDKDGVYQYLEVGAYWVLNEDNTPSHVQGVSRKVTDRINAEKAVRESEARFRLLAENTLDCIWTMDLTGNFTYINPAIYNMSGFTEDEWIGSNLKDHTTPEEFERLYSKILNAMKSFVSTRETKIRLFEAVMLRKDNSPVDVEVYGKLLLDNNKVVGIQGTTKDISDKKIIEANLHQARKMGYLGEMASGIAHEINNPLTGIITYSELLVEDYEEGSNEYEMLNDILVNSKRIDKIVHNLLRFARAEVTKAPNSIIKIILNALDHLEDKFKRYKIEIKKNFGEIELVMCDANLLEQVFINLLSNAVYAVDKKESDENRIIEISTFRKEDWTIVTIKDYGIGISAENLQKIFDPFFTTKAVGEGTGLGMSLTYGFIRDHKGTISVESKENNWTIFTIKLPVYKGQENG